MSKAKNRPDVDTLLAERARFEAWLDQLLAKASKVPRHVVERVRGDYEARLAKVIEELRSRADDLRAEVASLEERLGTLEQELGARQDARAEDELRAMVGEYDEGAWQIKSAEHDDGIRRVEGERDRTQTELSRVREMLSETTRPSRAMRAIDDAAIPEEPTPVDAAPSVAPEMIESEPEAAVAEATVPVAVPAAEPEAPAPSPPPSAPEVPAPRSPSPFDEIGFLRTVVGRATPFAGVEAPLVQRASVSSAPVTTATPPELPAISAAPPAPPEAPAAPPAAAPAPAPRPSTPPVPQAAVAPVRASAKAIPMPSFDEPMIQEPVVPAVDPEAEARAAEAARTLKCQECGWMNYPTEWYCEKCGGELAAF